MKQLSYICDKGQCPKGKLGLVFPTGTGRPEYHVNIVNRGLIPAWIAAGPAAI
jgi:integrase